MTMNSAEPTPKDKTRHHLILAGEKLFAQHGIDAVSLRQVNVAAGQKNSSASHYHFGSKEGLVRAVYDFRMARVNHRREELLDGLDGSPDGISVRDLAEAIILPIVDEIFADDEEGQHYIGFLAQATSHPADYIRDLSGSTHGSGLQRLLDLIRDHMPDLPAAIIGQRFGLALDHTIHALADFERLVPGGLPSDQPMLALFVSNLTDVIAGGLQAPISPATQSELARLLKRNA